MEELEQGSSDDDHDTEDAKLNSIATCLDVNIPSCPICLLTFSDQDIGTPESCDHHFCLTCIIEWSKNVNTCPFDRQVFHIIFARHQVDGEIYEKIVVADKALEDTEDDEQPTYCEVCGLCTGEERLLLCDGCDNGYHLECLNPPLANVPIEEWYCSDCAAPQPSTSTGSQHALGARGIPRTLGNRRVYQRVQQLFSDSSSDENDDDMECEDEFETEGDDEQVLYSLAQESEALESLPDTRINRKRKSTVKKKKIKRRRTKKSTGGKRKTSRRKKSRKQTWWKKRIAKAAPSSVKKRLADRLGLCAPPTGCTLPMVKSKKQSVDNEGLSMFGDRNSLNDVNAWRKVNKLKADKLQSLHGSAVSSPVAPSTDLLGSILDSQALLCTHSKDIAINRDGTLSKRSSTTDLPAFANETKPVVAFEQKTTDKSVLKNQSDTLNSLSNNDVTCCENVPLLKTSYPREHSKSGNYSDNSHMDNGKSNISTKQSLQESDMPGTLVCVEKNGDVFHNASSKKENGCLVEIKKHNILTKCSPNVQDMETYQSEHSKNRLDKNQIIEAVSKLPDQLTQIAPVNIIVNPITMKREGRRKYDSRDRSKLAMSSVDEPCSDPGSDIVVVTPPPKTPEEVIELSTDSDDERRARQAKKSRRHRRSHSHSNKRRRSSSRSKHRPHSRQRSRSRRHRRSMSHSPRRNRRSTSHRRSRTPPVRRSRSPGRRRLRTSVTRRSLSPQRRVWRSPVRRIRSRSPLRRYRPLPRRSPIRRRSRSITRRTPRKSRSPSRRSRTPRKSNYKTNLSRSPKQRLESSPTKKRKDKHRDSDISKHNGIREQRLKSSEKKELSRNRWSSSEQSISPEKFKAATLSAELEWTNRKIDDSVSDIDTKSKKSSPASRPSSRKSKSHKKKRSRKPISPAGSPLPSTDLRNMLSKKRHINTLEESDYVDKKNKKSEKKPDRSERKKKKHKKHHSDSNSENESTKTGSSKSQFNICDKQDSTDINTVEEKPVPAIDSGFVTDKSAPSEIAEKNAVDDSSPFQTQVDSIVSEGQIEADEPITKDADVDIVWGKSEEIKPVPPLKVVGENVKNSPYALASDEEPYDPADGLGVLNTNDIDEELEKKAEAQALQVIELLKNEVAEPDVQPPPPPAALTQKPLVIDWLVQKVDNTGSNTASPMPTSEQCGHSDEPTFSQASQEEDDVLTSATELTNNQLLNKMVCQERIADEVKVVLKPHYNKGIINKEEYKFIMKNCVTKIYQKSQGRVNPAKIKTFVEKYIQTTVARRKMK